MSELSRSYTLSLLYDYEKYIKDFGFITVSNFIEKWQCIEPEAFEALEPGLIVYDCHGHPYVITEKPWLSYNEDNAYYISATSINRVDINKSFTDEELKILEVNSIPFISGDLYYNDYFHEDYAWFSHKKKNTSRKGEKICPILITKTNQLQN